MRVFDSLEVVIVEGKKVFRCLECGYLLGPATENYKNHALRHEAPTSKAQPDFLVPSDEYILTDEIRKGVDTYIGLLDGLEL